MLSSDARAADRRVRATSFLRTLGFLLAVAATAALAMSTQLLVQPFVWRHWPWDEVLAAWLALLRQRLSVVLPLVAGVGLALHLPAPFRGARIAWIGAAVVLGALGGESFLAAVTPDGAHDAALPGRVLQWCTLAASVGGLWLVWHRAGALQAQQRDLALHRAQTERQLLEVRTHVLRSQIEPHFLFNTLATVRRLHRTDDEQGRQLLGDFLAYLRFAMPEHHGERCTLGREVELVRAYLGIVKVRMGERLQVRYELPSHLLACDCLPFSLATLVENAVKHGVGPSPSGGEIHVRASADGNMLELQVADTGVGFSKASSGGTGIGLANIRDRLRTQHGSSASLRLEAQAGGGIRAVLRQPLGTAHAKAER